MKSPAILGLALGGLLLIGMLILPRLLPAASRERGDASGAARQAHHHLRAHDSALGPAARAADSASLKTAPIDALLERAKAQLESIAARAQNEANRTQTQAREDGLTVRMRPTITANAERLRSAVEGFDKLTAENAQRLREAGQAAGSVSGATTVSALPHVAGLVQFVEAADALNAALVLRGEMHALLTLVHARLRDAATLRSESDYHTTLRDESQIAPLREALNTFDAQEKEFGEAAQKLETEFQQRDALITDLERRTDQARNELGALQERGYDRGGSGSFESYRQRVTELTRQIRELQDQWHLAHHGGKEGAKLTGGTSEIDATIEGGNDVIARGLLRERLAGAKMALERVGSARKSINDEIQRISDRAASAGEQAASREKLTTEALDRAAAALKTAAELSNQAAELETKAASGAQTAARSFGEAARAAAQLKNIARENQGKSDPNRKNDRLKLILADNSAEALGVSAQAEARFLASQAHTQRVVGLRALLESLSHAAQFKIEAGADPVAIQSQLNETRTAATELLNESVQAYQGAVTNQLPAPAKGWASVALAATHHTMALIDPDRAAEQRPLALAAINTALESLAKHPSYGALLASYRDALTAPPAASAPASEPTTAAASASAPTEEPKKPHEADDDFFGDEPGRP